MDLQTYSCNPTQTSVAGPYSYPQYVPMRTYAPMTPPIYSPPSNQMFFPSNYSQPVHIMPRAIAMQPCSPVSIAVPTIIQTPPPVGSYGRPMGSPSSIQGYGYPSRTASPVLHPSPSSSLVGMECLGYSMGNLTIRAHSTTPPPRQCVSFVVANQMLPTHQSTGLMTPPTQFVVPQSFPSPNMPTAQGPDLLSVKQIRTRSRSPIIVARGRSISRESESSESPTAIVSEPKPQPKIEPSKRDLVNKAFARLMEMFGEDRFDQDGNRGENIVRLKVKTRNALEHIVPFIERSQEENLISTVSCPISTKKGRQQVRGFLAYLETRNAEDADRLEDLVREYNSKNKSVFNTWHRNPVSTWKTSEKS